MLFGAKNSFGLDNCASPQPSFHILKHQSKSWNTYEPGAFGCASPLWQRKQPGLRKEAGAIEESPTAISTSKPTARLADQFVHVCCWPSNWASAKPSTSRGKRQTGRRQRLAPVHNNACMQHSANIVRSWLVSAILIHSGRTLVDSNPVGQYMTVIVIAG